MQRRTAELYRPIEAWPGAFEASRHRDRSGMSASRNGPKALVFDLGGVVIDIDFDSVFRRWADAARCGIDEIRARFAYDRHYEAHERGEIGAPEFFASLRDTLGIEITDDEFARGWNALFKGPIPGIAEILREASALFPLYALTNSNRLHETVWSVRFADTLRHFTRIFNSSTIGARKPEPEAFTIAARAIGADLHDIVFYDDSAENIRGALKLGIPAVHVRSIADIEESLDELRGTAYR